MERNNLQRTGDNSQMRFAFLVLPYSMKNAAIAKEMMIDYTTNHIYVKKDDGSIGSKTKELEDRLNSLLEDGTVGAAPIHEFTSTDKCIIFYHNIIEGEKKYLYEFQTILEGDILFNFNISLFCYGGKISVVLNEFHDPNNRPTVRVEGNKVYIKLDGIKYGKVYNRYLSTIYDQYITDINNIVAKYDYLMAVHPTFLPNHADFTELSKLIDTYPKSISTLVSRFTYAEKADIDSLFTIGL